MDLTFFGAAQTTTGSMHLVERRTGCASCRLRVYSGQPQGGVRAEPHTCRSIPRRLDAGLLLSHAHTTTAATCRRSRGAGFAGQGLLHARHGGAVRHHAGATPRICSRVIWSS
jgi:hypothetical protein